MISSHHLVNGLPTLRLPWLGFQCKMVCDQRSSSHRAKAPANRHFLAFACRDHGTSLYQESKLAIFSAASCKYSGQSTQSLRQQIRNTRRNIFLLATSNSWAMVRVSAHVQAPHSTVVLTTASNKRSRAATKYAFPVRPTGNCANRICDPNIA